MPGTIEVSEVRTGLFAEAADELASLVKGFNVNIMRADMIVESVERELELNLENAELKCMKENGTMDDLLYLEEAAEEGAIAKFKKMIDRIIQMFKDFVANIRNKVMSKICSAEARRTLNQVEKKVKMNPILAKKKVEVPNNKKALGVINKYKSQVDKVSAKVVKGIVTEHTSKTLGETKEAFRSEFNKSIAGSAGVMMITVAAVVAQLNTEIEKLPQFVDNCEKTNVLVLEKLKATVSEETAASCDAMIQACANFRSELAKEELNQHLGFVMDLMEVLRKTVLKAQGKTTATKEIIESADDFDYLANEDDIFGESADDDDDFLKGILGE